MVIIGLMEVYYLHQIFKIDFKIKPINKLRWRIDKNMSSGVWHQLSKQINTNNLKVLKQKSYVIHDGNEDSKMNSEIRKTNQ